MSDNYLLYDPAAFGALEIKEDTRDAEIERLRAENEKLRADVEDTKALLPNKHEADVPLRPTEHHDWWCVSIMERRKRIAAEKENEKLQAERDLWISRFEDFRKNAARLEEARSRPMRLVGSAAAAALKETDKENGDLT